MQMSDLTIMTCSKPIFFHSPRVEQDTYIEVKLTHIHASMYPPPVHLLNTHSNTLTHGLPH